MQTTPNQVHLTPPRKKLQFLRLQKVILIRIAIILVGEAESIKVAPRNRKEVQLPKDAIVQLKQGLVTEQVVICPALEKVIPGKEVQEEILGAR